MKLIRLAAYAISAFVVGSAIKAFAERQQGTRSSSPRNTRSASSRSRGARASKSRAARSASAGNSRAESQSTVHARSAAPSVRSH